MARLFLFLFFTSIAIGFCLFPSPSWADEDIDWYKVDRIGITEDVQAVPVPLLRDIWNDYSQAEALEALSRLGTKISEKPYRDAARILLLSHSRDRRESLPSPALLSKRISLLLQYGLFEDAELLYQTAMTKIDEEQLPRDEDLTILGLQLGLVKNDLAAFCLDIKILPIDEKFLKLENLQKFCRIRYSEGEKQSLDTVEFPLYPSLIYALQGRPIPEDAPASPLERMIANADNAELELSKYNEMARDVTSLSDLTVAYALKDTFQSNKTYQCFAIEATQRGLIDYDALEKIYEEAEFDEGDINNDISKSVQIHPCQVPSFFYQKLKASDNDEDKKILVKALLDVTDEIPASALVPLSPFISRYAELNSSNGWRAAVIMGLAGANLPDNADMNNLLPLYAVQNANQLETNDLQKWLSTYAQKGNAQFGDTDPALLMCISQILSSRNINYDRICKDSEYEKLYFLTYAKKSLNLGLGFNAFIADRIDNDDMASAIITLLSLVGDHRAKTLSGHDIAVILSALKALKLEKQTQVLVYKYLQ